MLAAVQKSQFEKSKPAAQSTDAAALAHDARNWLTVLQVYCDLLRRPDAMVGAMAEQRRRGWIEELSTAVERGYDLLASLLDAGQAVHPDPGAISFPFPPIHAPDEGLDLAAAVRRRWSLFQSMAGDRVQVEMDTRGGVGKVAMPEADFERVILNLVTNALDAMTEGGCLRILVKARHAARKRASRNTPKVPAQSKINLPDLTKIKEPESLVLTVSDTGDGIAPDLLPHIFERGISTRTKFSSSGIPRGLGLTNVRNLVMRHDGSIRVRANRVRGMRFEVELPVLHAQPALHTDISKAPRTRKERA